MQREHFFVARGKVCEGLGVPPKSIYPPLAKKTCYGSKGIPIKNENYKNFDRHFICRNCTKYPPNPPVKLLISQAKTVSSF